MKIKIPDNITFNNFKESMIKGVPYFKSTSYYSLASMAANDMFIIMSSIDEKEYSKINTSYKELRNILNEIANKL